MLQAFIALIILSQFTVSCLFGQVSSVFDAITIFLKFCTLACVECTYFFFGLKMLIVEYQLNLNAENGNMIVKKVKRVQWVVRTLIVSYLLMTVIPQFCLFILSKWSLSLGPLFKAYFVINAWVLSPLKVVITLFIWLLALRYIKYFDNLDQRKCQIIINIAQLYITLIFGFDFVIAFS